MKKSSKKTKHRATKNAQRTQDGKHKVDEQLALSARLSDVSFPLGDALRMDTHTCGVCIQPIEYKELVGRLLNLGIFPGCGNCGRPISDWSGKGEYAHVQIVIKDQVFQGGLCERCSAEWLANPKQVEPLILSKALQDLFGADPTQVFTADELEGRHR